MPARQEETRNLSKDHCGPAMRPCPAWNLSSYTDSGNRDYMMLWRGFLVSHATEGCPLHLM